MNNPDPSVPDTPTGKPRRRFFQILASAGSGLATWLGGSKLLQTRPLSAAEIPPPLTENTGTLLLRMQSDLERALASGRTPNWVMVVDTRKCMGCNACTVACRAENPTGPAQGFRRVISKELPIGPTPWAIYKPVNCLQCGNAPCAGAVPAGMIHRRADGIVVFDERTLRGSYADAAARACPWGLIHVDNGRTHTQNGPAPQPYEQRAFVENGRMQNRAPESSTTAGAARKCTFCAHLIDGGMLPACVSTCLGGAMYFGDANLNDTVVSEVTRGRRVFEHYQAQGVGPRVIWFEESMPGTAHVSCQACHY